MTAKTTASKTGLKKNVIKKIIFKREMALCKKLAKQNGGKCSWGRCRSCGVVPLLYKLHRGVLAEKPDDIKKIKSSVIKY